MQVIEYVQFLQEKVQKYEGSYQGWSPEPTKLMPWVKFLILASVHCFKTKSFRIQEFIANNFICYNAPAQNREIVTGVYKVMLVVLKA